MISNCQTLFHSNPHIQSKCSSRNKYFKWLVWVLPIYSVLNSQLLSAAQPCSCWVFMQQSAVRPLQFWVKQVRCPWSLISQFYTSWHHTFMHHEFMSILVQIWGEAVSDCSALLSPSEVSHLWLPSLEFRVEFLGSFWKTSHISFLLVTLKGVWLSADSIVVWKTLIIFYGTLRKELSLCSLLPL